MSVLKRMNQAPVEQVPIKTIKEGHRRREKMPAKDLKRLKESLADLGLIHPIVVNQDGVLVAGGRRLRAAQILGWTRIPARRVQVTVEELRQAELDENDARSDLDAVEASRIRLEEIQIAEDEAERVLRETSGTGAVSRGDIDKARMRARHRVAPERTRMQDRRLVKAVQAHPYMERWSKRPIESVSQALGELKRSERADLRMVEPVLRALDPKAAGRRTEKGISQAETVLKTFDLCQQFNPKRWSRILEGVKSADEDVKMQAVQDALEAPPLPDGRVPLLREALESLSQALKMKRGDEVAGLIKEARDAAATAEMLLNRALKELQDRFAKEVKIR